MNISKVDFKKIGSLLKICIIPILVGMLFVPFATGLIMRVKSSSGDVVTTYKTAFSFIFGGSLVSEHIAYTSKGCSPLGIVAYSLLAISLVLLIVSLFKKDRKSLILFLISISLILASSIMMFCMHTSAANMLADAIVGEKSEAIRKTISKNTTLGFGFIGVGIFGILSTLIALVSLFFDGTIDKARVLLASKA